MNSSADLEHARRCEGSLLRLRRVQEKRPKAAICRSAATSRRKKTVRSQAFLRLLAVLSCALDFKRTGAWEISSANLNVSHYQVVAAYMSRRGSASAVQQPPTHPQIARLDGTFVLVLLWRFLLR